jgi:uncharacterized protein (DUF4415 family)
MTEAPKDASDIRFTCGAGYVVLQSSCKYARVVFAHVSNMGGKMADDRTRRPIDPRQAAEAAFKASTAKPSEPTPKKPSVPNAKQLVSLRIDRDVLEHFQESGPGWQDRINAALRRIAGK